MTWIDTPYLRARVGPGAGKLTPVVSKKIHKHAHVRHRYQRLMREAHRALPTVATKNCDMVWVAKPTILSVKTLSDLQSTLDALTHPDCH